MKKLLLGIIALTISATICAADIPTRTMGTKMKRVAEASKRLRPSDRLFEKPAQMAQAVAKSAEAPAVFYEVPFKHILGKSEASICAQYVSFDSNGDKKTWKIGGYTSYSVCMRSTTLEQSDDWMISPAVHLLAGKSYILGIQLGSALSSGKEDKLEICLGNEQTVEAMTTKLDPTAIATQGQTWVDVTREFTVAADGYYYIGFHAVSETSKSGNLKICNFSIEDKASQVDPPAAGTLSYALAPKGELKATVTYTAPTKGISGSNLKEISKVEIETNWVVTNTFTDIKPGETRSFEVPLSNNAYNKIEATAYAGDKAGQKVSTDYFFAGPDNPLPVENVKISLSDDFKHVNLSWDPVSETGENGGYVDTSKVIYYIFDAFGSYYDPAIASTSDTSITLDYSNLSEQDFVSLQVTAGIDETYYSLATTSDIVVVGQPDATPFNESFANGYYNKSWAISPDSDNEDVMSGIIADNELQTNAGEEDATPEYLNSQDADNGFFYILPMAKDASFGIQSVKVDISKVSNPALEFYYQGKGSALDVLLATDKDNFKTIKTIDLKEAPTTGWTLCSIDLNPYKGSKYLQFELRLRAIHNTEETTWSVPIDNIRIRDIVDSDLRITALNTPSTVKVGESIAVKVNVENLGTAACQGAKITISDLNGVVATGDVPTLAPAEIGSVNFAIATNAASAEVLSLTVAIDYAADKEPSNNTAKASVKVKFNEYPTATELNGTASEDGTVSLKWTAPDYISLTKASLRNEDFESDSYEPLTISDFGGWTLYDGDEGDTYTFMRDYDNPYRTMPMAYQLYDPVLAGVPSDYLPDMPPHSGNTLLVAWSTNGLNDNWLISPELSGAAQTISFFGKSFTIAYAESFEVLYSTTDKNPESFKVIGNVENYPESNMVPESWTEFKVALPEGAKYFAIRHNAYDTYALMLDDFTFEATGALPADTELTGYNIYRNGKKLNDSPVSATEATDKPGAAGIYAYSVSAVYNNATESKACSPIDVEVKNTTGVGAAVAAEGISITASVSAITVKGAQGRNVTVADAAGATYHSAVATSESELIALPAGFYIVKAGNTTAKISVK